MSRPGDQMDAGAEHLVALLTDNGFETWQSCEGGECHVYRHPTVLFQVSDRHEAESLKLRLASLMIATGFGHFWISVRQEYGQRKVYQRVILEVPMWTWEFRRQGWLERETV